MVSYMSVKAGMAEEMAQLEKFLPYKREDLGSIPRTHIESLS